MWVGVYSLFTHSPESGLGFNLGYDPPVELGDESGFESESGLNMG